MVTFQKKHGMTRTKEYRAYINAKGRCLNPNNTAFRLYGGRGIEFRFSSFEEWLAATGLAPTPHHWIDRIDNDGHYEAGNLRWVTPHVSGVNRRQRAA